MRKQSETAEMRAYYGALAAEQLDFVAADDDKTRQEFKDETDINKILSRYGQFAPQRQVTYGGEVNYDVNLQDAFRAVDDAVSYYKHLPTDLKEQLRTPKQFVDAMMTGKLKEYVPKKSQGATPDTPRATPKTEESPKPAAPPNT